MPTLTAFLQSYLQPEYLSLKLLKMNFKYLLLLMTMPIAFSSLAQRQLPCGTITDMTWETPAFDEARYPHNTASKTTTMYNIPVVFHIVHQGGYENVADTFVYRLLNELNNKFANTAPNHAPDGLDVGVHFCLATIDTAGNPSTGIIRDTGLISNMYMYIYLQGLPTTFDVDSVLKKPRAWDPRHFLNYYIVKNAYLNGGAAGYATFPATHGQYRDGIVMDVDYINPSDTIFYHYDVIAHETGHYLGLYHTFEGGCVNTNCMTSNDRVCDTPPDSYGIESDTGCIRNSCTTDADDTSVNNPFRAIALGGLGDQNDDYRNYMDYTYCRAKFSPGQRARMIAALTTTRGSLLDSVVSICDLPPAPTVVNEPIAANVILSPNPFTDELTVRTPSPGNCSFTLIDLSGRVILRHELVNTNTSLSLGSLPPAPYIYILKNNTGILRTGRIIKE